MSSTLLLNRRNFIGAGVVALGACTAGSSMPLAAGQRILTPRQTEGPFYPDSLPLDTDTDLARVQGRTGQAQGQITHVAGRVLDTSGRPISGANVEIWQANAFGRYRHSRDNRNAPLDPNFQGFGRMTTKADGWYRFRTIKPAPYTFRTPHIHFAITGPGFGRLVTQMYVAGEERNGRDGPLNRIRDPRHRESLIVALRPAPEIEADALAGQFNIVLARGGRFGG